MAPTPPPAPQLPTTTTPPIPTSPAPPLPLPPPSPLSPPPPPPAAAAAATTTTTELSDGWIALISLFCLVLALLLLWLICWEREKAEGRDEERNRKREMTTARNVPGRQRGEEHNNKPVDPRPIPTAPPLPCPNCTGPRLYYPCPICGSGF